MNAQVKFENMKPYEIEVSKIEAQILSVIKKLVVACMEKGFLLTVFSTSACISKGEYHITFTSKCPDYLADSLQISHMNKQLETAKQTLKTVLAA